MTCQPSKLYAVLPIILGFVFLFGANRVSGQPDLSIYIVFSVECPVGLNHINDLKRLSAEFPEIPIELLFSDKYFTDSEVEAFMIRYGLIDKLRWHIDQNETMIRKLGARVMPTAFLVTNELQIIYQGKINDRPVSLGKVKPRAQTRYLANAVRAVLSGVDPPIKETEPVGCLLN